MPLPVAVWAQCNDVIGCVAATILEHFDVMYLQKALASGSTDKWPRFFAIATVAFGHSKGIGGNFWIPFAYFSPDTFFLWTLVAFRFLFVAEQIPDSVIKIRVWAEWIARFLLAQVT